MSTDEGTVLGLGLDVPEVEAIEDPLEEGADSREPDSVLKEDVLASMTLERSCADEQASTVLVVATVAFRVRATAGGPSLGGGRLLMTDLIWSLIMSRRGSDWVFCIFAEFLRPCCTLAGLLSFAGVCAARLGVSRGHRIVLLVDATHWSTA